MLLYFACVAGLLVDERFRELCKPRLLFGIIAALSAGAIWMRSDPLGIVCDLLPYSANIMIATVILSDVTRKKEKKLSE
jgi:hypothetical protein